MATAVYRHVQLFVSRWMFVRHKSKPNIQRTRLPHWERLKCLETVKPIFLPDLRPPREKCELVTSPTGDRSMTKFETLLGQQLLKYLDDSPLVGFYHANSVDGHQKHAIIKLLQRNNMRLGVYNRFIVRETLKNSNYAAVIPLFVSHMAMVFSKSPDVQTLLNLQKKMPQFILLAGIFENRLLSKEDLEWYAALPTLQVMYSHLSSTLTLSASTTLNHLGYHQKQLAQSLDTLAKGQESTDNKGNT